MAAKRKIRKTSPVKPAALAVPDDLKSELEAKASHLIENTLKPQHIEPLEKGKRFNYIIDIGTKWHRNRFYFFSTYACPWPKALSPTFKSKFARMEYIGNGKFALDFRRHTENWGRGYDSLTATQCLKAIRDDPRFVP